MHGVNPPRLRGSVRAASFSRDSGETLRQGLETQRAVDLTPNVHPRAYFPGEFYEIMVTLSLSLLRSSRYFPN